MFSLQDKGLSNKSIINIQGVLNIMLKEAYRKDLIVFNPMDKVIRFTLEQKKRDLLTLEEALDVLSPEHWYNPIYYAGNMLAAFTGMRSSEIRGLLCDRWHGSYIEVRKAYTDKGGQYMTKTKDSRLVPIPWYVEEAVNSVRNKEGYLLSHDGGKTPISGNRME